MKTIAFPQGKRDDDKEDAGKSSPNNNGAEMWSKGGLDLQNR